MSLNPKVLETLNKIRTYQRLLEEHQRCLKRLQKNCKHANKVKILRGVWGGEPTGEVECEECGLIMRK